MLKIIFIKVLYSNKEYSQNLELFLIAINKVVLSFLNSSEAYCKNQPSC